MKKTNTDTMPQHYTGALSAAILAGIMASCVTAEPAGPAALPTDPRRGLVLGDTYWLVKTDKNPLGPGPNYFSRKNVLVNGTGVILSVTGADRGAGKTRWLCAELYTQEEFSYGVFEIDFVRLGPLDSQLVFGFFLYDRDSPPWYGEADIEISFWGDKTRPELWFTVHGQGPLDKRQRQWPLPDREGTYSARIEWSRDELRFSVAEQDGSKLAEWTYRGEALPFAAKEVERSRVHLNLWLYRGLAPRGDGQRTVKITDFRYRPL